MLPFSPPSGDPVPGVRPLFSLFFFFFIFIFVSVREDLEKPSRLLSGGQIRTVLDKWRSPSETRSSIPQGDRRCVSHQSQPRFSEGFPATLKKLLATSPGGDSNALGDEGNPRRECQGYGPTLSRRLYALIEGFFCYSRGRKLNEAAHKLNVVARRWPFLEYRVDLVRLRFVPTR